MTNSTDQVVLVDQQGQPIGTMEKLKAHQRAMLHRAFSVFIVRTHEDQLQLLLQQRHPNKYHSGGLWTNTCCSHPRPDEPILTAGRRRLQEEMGFSAELKEIAEFSYQADVGNGLTEHEYDHVLIGWMPPTTSISPNKQEVATYRWISFKALEEELSTSPSNYTPWFAQAFDYVTKWL